VASDLTSLLPSTLTAKVFHRPSAERLHPVFRFISPATSFEDQPLSGWACKENELPGRKLKQIAGRP
jgi:hypothetical protein